MAKRVELELTAEQRQELEHMQDHDARPYLRERASALLKIANGASGRQVALHGLPKSRHCDTVYDWLRRYKAEGVDSLRVRAGRGRKPAFSLSARLRDIVGQAPMNYGIPRSRWTLAHVLQQC